MSQALTPEEIEKLEFHVTMRGYARDEVREFLLGVAGLVRQLEEKAETGYLNLGEKMGELLQEAKDAADELVTGAREVAEETVQGAKSTAARIGEDASARAADVVETAESHAAKLVSEAEKRVAELRADEDATRRSLKTIRAQLDEIANKLRRLEPVIEEAPMTTAPQLATEQLHDPIEQIDVRT